LLRDFGWKTIIDLGDITAARVGYQEEVSRINRLLEEHTRARAEFEKLLVSTMVITASLKRLPNFVLSEDDGLRYL